MLPDTTPRARERTPILRRATAGAVLIIAAALAIKLIVGFVIAVFWVIVGAAIVVAVLWALKTLLW